MAYQKCVNPNIASFIRWSSKISCLDSRVLLDAQSNHVNIDQFQGIYIDGLSHFGHCIGKLPPGLISNFKTKVHIFSFRYIDIKKVQNLYRLFESLCEPTL